MYPTSYQGKLITSATGCYDWLFKKVENAGKYARILDYGCGNGKFVAEAVAKGYQVTGIEYNEDLVQSLAQAIPGASFLTIGDFTSQTDLYDVIFLGNVLEHLTNPSEMLAYFKERLSTGGLLILEGPLEENFTIAGALRRWFFKRRKKRGQMAAHFPRHIFYADYNNQLDVLTRAGFEKIKYKVGEKTWPFPATLRECTSVKSVVFLLIGWFSIGLGWFIPHNGNLFFYIGRSISEPVIGHKVAEQAIVVK
ncbi:bifunctional 2-polyprenyl-6-hydroxyphenol methylase/3-demethylubiquinol 3-O-methyltransferase UbiG [Mucilaginibacter sp. PPCGB 2223]|uniref:class I SAM-dependent methyltransferase n=1 Tax=Mucilaginibacter sp. PPCGB 2223 TaxID=1886027 RepID=UPI001586B147|nr:class I SAM-dependent methyltransferase [Mucilaginibacter sp. PPCGB 2223]